MHQGNRKENKHALTPSPLEPYSYKYPRVARRSHRLWHGNLALSLPSTLAGKIMARSRRVRKRFKGRRRKSQTGNMLAAFFFFFLHNHLLCWPLHRVHPHFKKNPKKPSVYAADLVWKESTPPKRFSLAARTLKKLISTFQRFCSSQSGFPRPA